jgi:phospholipase/carboxylesterase
VNPQPAVAPVLAGVPLESARMAAVLVHGRDQDEREMLDVAARLGIADVAYVLPIAAGRSWYPGRYFDPLPVNQPWLERALDACDAAVARAHRAGMPDERIVVAGFSQGACVIAELVARRPRPWAGVAILTGKLLGPAGERVMPAGVGGLPMFLCASRHDDWIALDDAVATARAFEAVGASVTFETYEDRAHHINDRAVDGLRRLLRGVKSAPSVE